MNENNGHPSDVSIVILLAAAVWINPSIIFALELTAMRRNLMEILVLITDRSTRKEGIFNCHYTKIAIFPSRSKTSSYIIHMIMNATWKLYRNMLTLNEKNPVPMNTFEIRCVKCPAHNISSRNDH